MEIKFERGGTLPFNKGNKSVKSNFGSKKHEEKDKTSKQKISNREIRSRIKISKGNKNDDEIEIRSSKALNFRTLAPDMIIMAVVKSIHQTYLLLNLPGRLVGRCPINKISHAYSNALKSALENDDDDEDPAEKPKSLAEMFSIGQVIYTKVIEKCHGENQEILLSLLPEDINFEITDSMLVEGSVIICAIKEFEDHGYFLETGLNNIRGFLPKKPNVKEELKIGQLIYCKVQKISSNIITFTSFKKNEHVKLDSLDVPNVKTLLPGIVVNFTIVQILKDGLEGLLGFDGSITAYVNEIYISSKLSMDTNLIGKEVKARVLYTMPLSNQIYVTLNVDEQQSPAEKIKSITYGTVIEKARVLKQINGGVLFMLSATERGFLPRKTIIRSFKNNFDLDSAMIKFSPNTLHKVRVMDYNIFENCFLCTNIEKMLNEKFFGTFDFHIGQIVQAKIVEKIRDDSLKLSIGNVRAFLNGVFYHKQANIVEGADIRVRIAEIDHDTRSLQVTNKTGFLRDGCKIFDTKAKLKVNACFTGVVMKNNLQSYTVLFFNHLKGILPKTKTLDTELISIGSTLEEGTIKLFEISKIRSDGTVLLGIPKKIDTKHLGKVFTAKVTAILPTNGLQIYINELKSYGKVPIHYLSEFPSFNEHILSAMAENSMIEVVAFGNNIFSLRDAKYYKNCDVLTDFNEVKPNSILRCAIIKTTENLNIELECPLKNFNETIRLNRNAFDDAENFTFNTGDIVYVNIIAKNEGQHSSSLFVTPALHKVWTRDDDSLTIVENYLDDVSLLMSSFSKAGKAFGKFAIGQRVNGTVKNIIGNNLLIEIEENVYAQGTVDNVHIYKVNGQIKDAAIVWADPINQILYVTTKDKCKNEISLDQEIDEKTVNEKKHKAFIVYFNDYVTVCTTRKHGPLIYAPTKNHYNDFSATNDRALGNATSKLVIKRSYKGKLLGLFVHDRKAFQKMEKLISKLDQKNLRRKKNEAANDAQESDNDEEGSENKRPKVVLDSESDLDDDGNDEAILKFNKKNDITSKKNSQIKKGKAKKVVKAIGNVMKNPLKMPKGKAFVNKDSLLDDNLVNLTSFKQMKEDHKSTSIGVNSNKKKLMKKSTIGNKRKGVKRLIKKN